MAIKVNCMSNLTRVENKGIQSEATQNQSPNLFGRLGSRVVEWVKENPVATVLIVSLVTAAIFAAVPYLAAAALGLAFGTAMILPSLALVGATGGIGALVGGIGSGVIVVASRSGEKKVLIKPGESSDQRKLCEIKERHTEIRKNLKELETGDDFQELVKQVLYVATLAMDHNRKKQAEEAITLAEELINKESETKTKEDLLQIMQKSCESQHLSEFWTSDFLEIARKS